MADVKLDPDALAVLEEQRAFLRSSLVDLDAENEAGDLDDADYTTLKIDYESRLAAVSAAIDEGKAAFAAAPRRDPRRVALWVGAVTVFAVLCGVVVANLAGRRTAGESITGATPGAAARDQLPQCYTAWFTDLDLAKAATCFDDVAAADPTNAEAKTYGAGLRIMALDPDDSSFLEAVAALVGLAQGDVTYGDPHAFLALAWKKLGQTDSAGKELARLDQLQHSNAAAQIADAVRTQLAAPPMSAP